MKKTLPNTKVTVKLRRSNYKEEWYLIIESSPVYKRGSKRASRVVERLCQNADTAFFYAQSPDFLKPGLCYYPKCSYL